MQQAARREWLPPRCGAGSVQRDFLIANQFVPALHLGAVQVAVNLAGVFGVEKVFRSQGGHLL